MLKLDEYHLSLAEILLRCFAGFLFFFQGYDKLFRLRLKEVVRTFHIDAESHHVPGVFVWLLVIYTSFAELIGGILLILGLFKSVALALLGLDLVFVVFAFTMIKPMWDMKHVFPRFLLIIALLLLPAEAAKWGLDQVFFSK